MASYSVATRSASQTRMPSGRGGSNSTMGMGDRTTSLPALGTRASPGRGYPSTSEAKGMKRTPSELLSQRRDLALVGANQPKITGFMDIGKYSNHTESAVPYDRPLFSVMPPVIAFQDFEGLQTYEATVTLRNQDKVARRVKVYEPDSSFFELRPGRNAAHSRRSSSGGSGDKVAPGMEVSYVVRFKPDAKIDYSYDLVVVTEREKFAVPIRASGGSALLTFPDEIDFGDDCVVGHRSERTVLVRNVGDRTTKFSLRTHPPFGVTVPDGYLAEGAACQVSVYFTPDAQEPCVAEMQLRYEELEATVRLRGGASNANISLSTDNLVIENTYVGLEAQDIVIIRNESDVPVDFRWHLLPSQLEEHEHRRALQRHLKGEEGDEMLYLCQQHDEDSSDDQSEEDGERVKARRNNKVTTALSRKYSSINKAVKEDPMLFRDAIFAIEPLIGQIWPHSQVTCACTFLPKDALMYICTAYLSCVGQESRARLMLKGLGIGPKATFSYDELDVGSVFVDSTHRYEVQLLNQGDIEVDFRLVPRDTQMGKQFNFTPSSGTIAVGGHCEVVVDFKPKELGEFMETFEWALKGSNAPVILCFRGVSVQPSFEFDVEKLPFGTVSYGFLNSRMMALTNTSEVPCIYTLRIPEDETNEFDIIPSNGTLLPGCSQRVQVDFVSITEKRYDLRLVVDLEGVGKELLSIPITAVCSVPSVSFEPQAGLNYGDIFIRYPFHQSLYLHNTSALPAKFRVLQQEDKSRAEFEPDQWTGTVPPCASHVVTVTLTAHTPGPLRISMYVKMHGNPVPLPLTLNANSVGPRVVVDPPALDWGSVKCLEAVTRHVRVTNDSCIDATVRAFMNERRSLWSVHPKMMHLSPQETLQLAVTLKIDETCPVKDILNLIVSEGSDLTVEMKGKGTETPIQSEQPLDLIDFGTIFTTHHEPRDIVIRNYGQVARRLTWFKEKEKKKEPEAEPNKKGKVQEKIQAFRVEPESAMLDPKSAYRFTFVAMSRKPGTVDDFLCCNEQVDKGGNPAKQIFRPRFRAVFVAPQLKLSTTEIKFNFVWGNGQKEADSMTQTLILENTSPLEVKCRLDAPYPFSASVDETTISPGTELEVVVAFYPAHRVSRESGTVTKSLIIVYEDHPATNTIQLIGDMVFPNVELDSKECDFGTVLNETSKKINVRLTNPTSLEVCYRWCFSVQGEDEEEVFSKQVSVMTTGPMQASAVTLRPPTGNTVMSSVGNTGQFLGSPGARRLEEGSRSPSAGPSPAASMMRPSVSNTGQFLGSAGARRLDEGSHSPSAALSPTSMMRTTQSATQDRDDVDLNQVFDILPIFGKIDPGESQVVTFTYYGIRDRTFKASAVCAVDGGPEYEVKLSGSAAPCKYGLDVHELDFGDIPFINSAEQEVVLSNPGRVTTSFNFNLTSVSRPGIVDVHPQSGELSAGDKQRVQVRFRAGIPDRIEETVLVEIAHFAPEVLTIRGNGTFPGVVLELPRWNAEAHEAGRQEATRRLMVNALAAPADVSEAKTASPLKKKMAKTGTMGSLNSQPVEKGVQPFDAGLDLLEVECEVDRFNLCNELLEQARLRANSGFLDTVHSRTSVKARTSGFPSPTSTRRLRGTKNEAAPTITAAHYICDFGHLPLGHFSHRQIVIHNGCSEAVSIAMDKTVLQENGVTLEPEKIKSIPAKGSQALQLSVTRPFEETEAKVEFDWIVPVRGGPMYKISMVANFVIPDFLMSSTSIDFGRVLVGTQKRVTLEFRNHKTVAVDWLFQEPKGPTNKKLPWDQVVFNLAPSSGSLAPGATMLVVASFSPHEGKVCSGSLVLRVRDNAKKKVIQVSGRGDLLRLDVGPTSAYDLGPVMPSTQEAQEELVLYNPTDYAIEVYSVDFDRMYLEEERALLDFDGYEPGFEEVPVRYPADGLWKKIAKRVVALRQSASAELASEGQIVDKAEGETTEEVSGEEERMSPEAQAIEDAANNDLDEGEDRVDPTRPPYRVPVASRVNALIFGPPKAGLSTLAKHLASEDQRKVLKFDDVIEWAVRFPRFLVSDRLAKRIGERINSKERPTVEEAAHLLRRRTELADCNAGVIVDGFYSEHLHAGQVVEAVLEAFRGQKTVVMAVKLPTASGEREGSLSAESGRSDSKSAEEVKGPSPSGALLCGHYEALRPVLAARVEELKGSMPDLEAALRAAEDEMAARAAAAAAERASADEAGETAAATEESAPALSVAFDEEAARGTSNVAEETEAAGAVTEAARRVEQAKEDLASCEAALAWKPPPAPGQVVEEVAPAPKAKAKAKAKGAPAPTEAPPEPQVEKAADVAVEHLVATYLDQHAVAMGAVAHCNARARQEEEERQHEAFKRARAKAKEREAAAAAKSKAKFAAKRNKLTVEPEEEDFTPVMDDWVQPVSEKELTLCGAPFELLFEEGRSGLPMSLIPEEMPLPAPSVVQLLTRPPPRGARVPPPNFKILTPVPASTCDSERPNSAALGGAAVAATHPGSKAQDEMQGKRSSQQASQDELQKPTLVPDITRWIIEPLSEQRLFVHFASEEVGVYEATLNFEMVGDSASGPIPVRVTGTSALPAFNSDTRFIFPKRKKQRPLDGYAVKTFVTSLNTYDFGPLLVGRDPEGRVGVVNASDPSAADGEPKPDSAGRDLKQEKFLLNHAETIKISNDSLFPANIRLGLVSQQKEEKEDPAPPAPEPKKAAKGKPPPPEPPVEKPYCPFIVEPTVLQLGIGEQADVRIWCFPKEKGVLEDSLVALVEHNPDPVVFSLCAVGTEPTVILDTEEVDMERLLVNWRAEERRVRLKNASSLPTAWQLVCDEVQVTESPEPVQAGGARGKAASKEPSKGKPPPAGVKGGGEGLVSRQVSQDDDRPPAIPEEFQIEPLKGKLAPGEEFEVRINFKAARAMDFKCGLRLESKDCEGFKGWESAGRFAVQAKTFEVDIAIEPDPLTSLLDFGTVLVHSSVERTFEIVNRGRFAARYELNVRKALRDLLVIDKVQAELAPGERRTVKVTCMPARVFESFVDNNGISALVFDTVTGNQVDQKLPPVRVGVTAVYNQFQVTPPRGVNFGPVEKGEVVSRTFSVRNIGLFAFDWALFDQAEPPVVGEDGAPVLPKDAKDGKLKAGPFTVRPCTGSLEPDSDTQVEVTFEAQGDEDYESRLGLWVDGVECASAEQQRVGSATRVGGTAMQSFNGTFGATAGGVGGVDGAAAYTLTAQSCIAGINTKDLQTIFEEQFFTINLEDAIAIAGRVDVRAFCESDHIFHFGPVLANGGSGTQAADTEEKGVVERLRLSNPKAIPAKVALSVTSKEEADTLAKDKGKKAAADDACAFEVSPKELVIPPHDSRHIEVSFRPSRIATFGALLEANVIGGTDPTTNQLAFELRGDGAMPSVNLLGPVLVGDDGFSTLQMGGITVSKRHEVRMALRNSGLLPATVRVDLAPTPHFTVACPYSVSLDKGEEHTFSVCFHPTQPGLAKAELNIRTLGNPFEDYSGPRAIQVTGEGFSDQVAWDLHEVKLPHAAQAQPAEELSQVSAPSPPNDLQLGEVEVGQEVCVSFQLANKTAHPIRFEMPEAAPAPFGARLSVQPSTGFVRAGAQQPVALTFKPTEKLEANKVLLACKTFQVDLQDEGADSAETKFQELPGTTREVPLMVSAVADVRRIQCETREIKFSETMMFNTKVHRFTVRNLCGISVPFRWHVEGDSSHAFSVEPASGAVPPSAEKEVAVRFAPLEVEDFGGAIVCTSSAASDTGEPPEILRIPVSASALRPWCRVELEPSDYPSRRLADSPLDPKCRVCEITSLGTNVKNTKRFYVANPTSESVDFVWQKETPSGPSTAAQAEDDDTLRCLTKRGTILPGKKFEMAFEFAPSTGETKESFWVFMLIGPRVEEHFLIAGTVEQPRVGFDRPHINFGERLLGGATQEDLCLVNKEHIPFSFSIDPLSFQPEGQTEALSIKPLSGVVSPNSSLSLQVTFAPEEEQPFNFNVVCNVKRKKDPVILNVKGIGYKIHASLAVDEPAGRRAIQPGVVESLDFGLLQVHERRTMKLYLSNDTKRNFNYRLQMKSGAQRRTTAIGDPEQPPYLAFSNLQGVAEPRAETPIEITYAPRDAHSLDGSTLQVMVPAGPREDLFTLNIAGSAKKSRVEFSFVSHDFGPCFVAKDGATAAGEPLQDAAGQGQERVELVCTNRDDNDIHIATNFQREPWLDVQLHSAMVESGKSIRIPIVFSPREICEYMQRVEFSINEYTQTAVDIRGRGCPLRLEVAQVEMQNVDFGVVVGGEVPIRAVKLANRSARPVSFELVDENGELTDRAVTWAPGPGQALTLKPKETCDVELRFAPTYSIKPFRLPLYARCNNGVEVKLFQVAGTGHSTEVRLSEQSLFFGNVVVGSQASRSMRLHNFGDIGAKFRFEVPEKYRKVFSVSPCEGFARPQEDVSLTVTFSPTADGAQSAKRISKGSSANKRPAADVPKDVGISTRDIRCVLEGHPPLQLEASGRCVSLPAESKTVAFSTEVRTKTQNSITISNPTDSDWKLFPQVSMTEPQGETYFSCPKEVVVPAGKQTPVEITYMPLTMTGDKDAAAASRAAASRSEKHRGNIFVGTPDGSALLYSLEGVALPIKAKQRLEAQVPCKKQHVQKVPLKNWLHSKQRFDVKVDLVNPAPGTAAAQGITLQGVNTLDLPGGVEREYRFNIYAYHEGSALVNVRFTSQETGEYIIFEVALKFCAPEKLATINLEAACRQTARHKIAVANPLDTPAKFTGSCSNPYVRFSPDSLEVPAKGEKTIDLLFRPVEEGDGEAEATLNSDELGTYPYRVAWKATPAGFEKTMVLKAPLGGSAVEKFKFLHFASGPVTYTASVEPAPGGKGGNVADFVLEAKDVKADACDFGRAGLPCELAVRYTPSSLGERHALLTVSGTGGGEYKALLTGFAQPPQPQGPIAILNGKQGTVEFRNPFDVTVEFSVKVDNPCFTVPQKLVKLDTQKSTSITVTFKSDRSQNGRLVISCEATSMPWVFFLKGDV